MKITHLLKDKLPSQKVIHKAIDVKEIRWTQESQPLMKNIQTAEENEIREIFCFLKFSVKI